MNNQVRSLFPALEHYTYLNSASVSPMPRTAVEAVTSQLNDVSTHGALHYLDWIATKTRARDLLGEMLHVRPDQIAFMRNTSDGVAAMANGIDWAEGDNIVSFQNEFPANFYPWRGIRDRFGVELRLCPEREGRIDLDELISMIDSNTKVVAISAVQFSSGFRVDLERVGRAASEVDALFGVDIIQGFGARGFDLPGDRVDFAAGAAHKWLCAPEGVGILYISDRARDRIEPTFVGWISVVEPWHFDDREQPFQPNALAWESGTGVSSLFYGLEQSLKLLNDIGLDNIRIYLDDLADFMCELLAAKDYDIVSSRDPKEKSAIVCVKHGGGIPSNEIAKRLEEEKIVVTARDGRVRISPHFYNNKEDIERLVDALP